jgi:hypothetical protein
MPWARDVIVPNAVKGIEEVVVTHTKKKRGTYTTEKVVPIVLPKPKGSRQSSKSKKGLPSDPWPNNPRPKRAIPTEVPAEWLEENQFLDEQEYGVLDPIVEPSQPQVTVCGRFDLRRWPH